MKLIWILSLCIVIACVPAWATKYKCGYYHCARRARCKDSQCECRESGVGDFLCHKNKDKSCFLIHDPRLIEEKFKPLLFTVPCRHRITDVTLKSKCGIKVMGTVAIQHVKYPYEVAIEVTVEYDGHKIEITLDAENNVYFYIFKGKRYVVSKSGEYTVYIGCKEITLRWSEHEWVIQSKKCGFMIVFRPPTGGGRPCEQDRLPGVGIVVKKTHCERLEYIDLGYPDTHCSVFRNLLEMVGYQKKNKYNTINIAIVGAWIMKRLDQGPHRKVCEETITEFHKNCKTTEQKTKAINICAPIFENAHRPCFNKRGKIMNAFDACAKAVCSSACMDRCNLANFFKEKGCELPLLGVDCTSNDKLLL